MYTLKTKVNDKDVMAFIEQVAHKKRKEDAIRLLDIFHNATGEAPKMWGDSIIGYGQYHYKYASGQEGDWMKTGFSPRKQYLSIYLMQGFDQEIDLLSQLGKHKTGKGCLYINKLEDVDLEILSILINKCYSK